MTTSGGMLGGYNDIKYLYLGTALDPILDLGSLKPFP